MTKQHLCGFAIVNRRGIGRLQSDHHCAVICSSALTHLQSKLHENVLMITSRLSQDRWVMMGVEMGEGPSCLLFLASPSHGLHTSSPHSPTLNYPYSVSAQHTHLPYPLHGSAKGVNSVKGSDYNFEGSATSSTCMYRYTHGHVRTQGTGFTRPCCTMSENKDHQLSGVSFTQEWRGGNCKWGLATEQGIHLIN